MKINEEDIVENIFIVMIINNSGDNEECQSHHVFSELNEAYGFSQGAEYAFHICGAKYLFPLVLPYEFLQWESLNFCGHEEIKKYIKDYESKL